MKTITRQDAKVAGLTRFYTGRPCLHGHDCERLVCNNACSKCQLERVKRTRRSGGILHKSAVKRNRLKKKTDGPLYNTAKRHRKKWAKTSASPAAFRRRLSDLLRTHLRGAMWRYHKGHQKGGSAVRDLGCTIDELKQHLNVLFKYGMSWKNYGEWQIDHKRPLSSFDLTKRSHTKKAFHFTNLQPLWKHENLSKGAKYDRTSAT